MVFLAQMGSWPISLSNCVQALLRSRDCVMQTSLSICPPYTVCFVLFKGKNMSARCCYGKTHTDKMVVGRGGVLQDEAISPFSPRVSLLGQRASLYVYTVRCVPLAANSRHIPTSHTLPLQARF